MSNLAKLEFAALDISRKNYLSWILDAEDKAKAMIFFRRHLYEGLKIEYLTVKDPSVLWKNLKVRYDHQKIVILPKARYDWMHLRLQDFKTDGELHTSIAPANEILNAQSGTTTNMELVSTKTTFFGSFGMINMA
ncbi:uncharacterized protein LOC114165409 [Vigna unguiculata]|uniref:uncharacterized protein LOC114165409 n=1 Tax=Vigna unguiculata TaxID=3917 RepID=UPI0010171FE2|nr:uncharacterized protein LOC114165409 [Vigna unguiculata]